MNSRAEVLAVVKLTAGVNTNDQLAKDIKWWILPYNLR